MNDEDRDRWFARAADTKARFGIELPIVDYEKESDRSFVEDEDALALFLVKYFQADLNAFEVIVEDAHPSYFRVLFAGMTKPPGRRFVEWRLVMKPDFLIQSKEKVLDRDDRVRINTPRWASRDRA